MHFAVPQPRVMMARAERLAPRTACSVALSGRFHSQTNAASSADPVRSAVPAYQPDFQLVFLLVERLIEVNLYSTPTEMAKFTSYCE